MSDFHREAGVKHPMESSKRRIVYGSYRNSMPREYQMRIVPARSPWLRRSGWRWELLGRWTSWSVEAWSKWFADRSECEASAHRVLDRIEDPPGEPLMANTPETTEAT